MNNFSKVFEKGNTGGASPSPTFFQKATCGGALARDTFACVNRIP